MSMFDTILKGIGGAPDDVANLAEKVGIDPSMAEKAIAALGHAHQLEGDTVEAAAAKTGLPKGTLNQIVEQIGGEGSLMAFANMSSMPVSMYGAQAALSPNLGAPATPEAWQAMQYIL